MYMRSTDCRTAFLADEDGAGTVDWVVLSALVCTMCALAIGGVADGTTAATEQISTRLLPDGRD